MTEQPCPHGYANFGDCDTCLSFSHTDLDEIPEAKLILIPMAVVEAMQNIIDAPMMPTDSDEAAKRFADLSTILSAVTP